MTRTFNVLTKIELTETQNKNIDDLIFAINKYDTAAEIAEVYLSMADVTNGILNDEFCPIIFINNNHPSDSLYENIKESCKLMPEYISRVEEIPTRTIILWKQEG